jgi:hypothetical protein
MANSDYTQGNQDNQGGRGETLDQGYGQSERMGEEQWSQEGYDRDAREVASRALDTPGEPGGGRSDVDRMAGGLVGEDEDTTNSDLAARRFGQGEQSPGTSDPDGVS